MRPVLGRRRPHRFGLPGAAARPDDCRSLPAASAELTARVWRRLNGDLPDFSDVRYDFHSVAGFPREVDRATLAVKASQTSSYGDIAARLGDVPGLSRAVGTALGLNPWPLLVPCHRIVSARGRLTGFSGPGGIRTKLRLLALEGAQRFAECDRPAEWQLTPPIKRA